MGEGKKKEKKKEKSFLKEKTNRLKADAEQPSQLAQAEHCQTPGGDIHTASDVGGAHCNPSHELLGE